MPDDCDFCGKPGCTWQNHAEARDDVTAWKRFMANDENTTRRVP